HSLLEKDYYVTVVNKNYTDCKKLAEIDKLNVIYGDGSKKFILEDADAASCQVAISLTESDETNLIICEMCKEFFHVKKTVSMLNDPSKTEFFYQMGIDRVVCALNMITNIMEENALMDEMMKMIPLEKGKVHIAETTILHNSSLIGKKLWELNLPKEIIIGCILRGDQSLIPRGDTSVKEGDILLMITSNKQKLNTLKELTIS
ncbi:MAG: potassium channel family protein, partial [Floccifex sp.]